MERPDEKRDGDNGPCQWCGKGTEEHETCYDSATYWGRDVKKDRGQ